MFMLKKIIGVLLMPGTIVLLLLGYGLLKLTLSRGPRKSGWGFLALGVLCFYFFTTTPLPDLLIRQLENQYQPIADNQDLTEIQYIVVLSGGARLNFQVPPTSQLSSASALRVAEGIRLFHLLSGRPLLIMAGGGGWLHPQLKLGEQMVAFARCQGIPAEKLIAETHSGDTHANAVGIKLLIKDAPFLLVTSAAHLPRAIRIFQLLGMRPIPAPADFWGSEHYCYYDYVPSGGALITMEAAIHEYLGLAYLAVWPSRAGD
jgi:uncharacterized SAM-binding protein YcdF (DUF218 family)